MTEAINWQKSSFSGPDDNQSCIEPALVDGLTKLRESDDPRVVVTIRGTSTSRTRGPGPLGTRYGALFGRLRLGDDGRPGRLREPAGVGPSTAR
ncbi:MULTISPECIES: DUF397 domain-containing protein [unclassified Streptomyces]|uniref:DUF397 domain-containing protein n=1 Tax=unclassified Streptomyces TaxID=2593676 RepID=UPI00093C2E6F|nr:DUF397 domain-containing protein [Streptomyces sp. CB00316]